MATSKRVSESYRGDRVDFDNTGTSFTSENVEDALKEIDPQALNPNPSIPDSSTTTKGIIERATDSEASTGTDNVRAVTPRHLKQLKDSLVFDKGTVALWGGTTTIASIKSTYSNSTNYPVGTLVAFDQNIPYSYGTGNGTATTNRAYRRLAIKTSISGGGTWYNTAHVHTGHDSNTPSTYN